MNASARISVAAALLGLAGCSVPAPGGDEDLGAASEAYCDGYFVANVVPHGESFYQTTPQYLLDSSEGWGPQTLQLVVDRHVAPEVIFQTQPGVQLQKEKITKTLQNAVAFSLRQEIELTASSAHEVLPGAYERLEAYPTFQSITFDVYVGACGPFGNQFVARGTCLKPRGLFFRVVTYVAPPPNAARTAPNPAPGMSAALPEGTGEVPVTDTPPGNGDGNGNTAPRSNGNGGNGNGSGNGNGAPSGSGPSRSSNAAGPAHD